MATASTHTPCVRYYKIFSFPLKFLFYFCFFFLPHTHKSQGRRSSEAGSLKTVVATVLAKKRVHLQVMWEWVEVLDGVEWQHRTYFTLCTCREKRTKCNNNWQQKMQLQRKVKLYDNRRGYNPYMVYTHLINSFYNLATKNIKIQVAIYL